MKINIYKSSADRPHVLYGDVLQDDHEVGYTFDRVYIYKDGKIEICGRTEYQNGAFDESDIDETLNTSMHKRTIEHTLSRFFGISDGIFCWDIDATEYVVMNAIDGICEPLEVDDT